MAVIQTWRYTPNANARDWVKAASVISCTDDVIPTVEQVFNITVTGRATVGDVASAKNVVSYQPRYVYLERAKFLGGKDAIYQQLMAAGRAEDAIARADELIAADDAAKAGG